MNKSTLFILFSLVCLSQVNAQTGGQSVHNFLDFSYSGRLAALGGNLISVRDNDPTLILTNPSSIGKNHHNSLALHFTNYFANVGYGSALYSRTFDKIGSFAMEMRFVGYGKFNGTDVLGQETGVFTAGDYALTVGWGRPLAENFSIGANFKMVYAHYESYSSFGIAADLAGTYFNDEKRLSLTLLVKNIGSELKPFTSGNYQRMPFDIQLALSQRFAHLPVRYHISLHSLYKWDMVNTGSLEPFLDRDPTMQYKYPSKASRFFDNFFRHIIFGIEIEPVKYFSLLVSYNHNRRQEMKIPQRGTMAGFSYGFMIDIRSVRFGFARSHYAVGAVPNYFTFSANIDELSQLSKDKKKKKLQRLN